MEVAAKLALFTGALVLALVTGWGLGQLAGPYMSTFTPDVAPSSQTSHAHLESP